MKKRTLIIMIQSIMIGAYLNAQNPDYTRMVEYAIKAPSGHNAQPWKFKLTENRVEIHPDFSRTLSIVDSTNRELYISLGAATENLCIASHEFGYQNEVKILPDNNEKYYISISLTKTGDNTHQLLFNEIVKRQTNRQVYTGKMIPQDSIDRLMSIVPEKGITFHCYANGVPDFSLLKEFVMRGNEIQMNDKAFKCELISWIRLNKREVEKHGDGLTYKAMGSPSVPNLIGKPIVRSLLNEKTQNKSDEKKINSSSHFVLFTCSDNSAKGWIALGRTLERFLLESTRMGLANAYMNQPCEVMTLADDLRKSLTLTDEYPTLLLRIGYAPIMLYSPRKPVSEVIVAQ